ncbi:hypothetical protein BJ912DRAFT_439491 [Pholiota molesta]|nr:hypothetical protein BJ912DRAFT_439491 [Pholiota molesta]
MPAAHCAICLNHFPIDADKPEFLIFPCGHGFCVRCTDQLFSQRRTTCPTCRKDIRKADGHPVYLELVDKNTVYARTVIEGLDQMGPNTPLGSVQKASLKLEKAITTAPQDTGTTLPL